MSYTLKQPAISKHPDGTGSYYLRVHAGGGYWQVCTETPLTLDKLIASMEENLERLRRLAERRTP